MTARASGRPGGATENVRDAVASVRAGWTPRWSLAAGAAVVSALLPLFLQDDKTIRGLAWVWLFALAAVGLNIVLGLGNMASVGHGAFVAIGAVTAASLRTRP